MERWTADDDRPYVRQLSRPGSSAYPWVIGVLLAALAASIGYYFWATARGPIEPSSPARLAPQPEAAPAPQAAAPGIAHPVTGAPDTTLPTLENSDSMMREALVALLGMKAFNDLVVPDQLVRRIVATVDNLPRPTAPRRMMPLNPVPGALTVTTVGSEMTVDPMNATRYAPYVRVFEALQASALVYAYTRAYPLFQRAYEELGFPGLYFNDRLVEAIDDLLAAPEPAQPPSLLRPKVLYEFADRDLETRSAGQKVMVRMGADNERRVKAKLREIRAELGKK